MREPAVAGMFYPSSERALRKELSDCFRKGPGREVPSKGKKVLGLVAPHAGYTYSGPTAAYGYLALADGGPPKTAVIIGPNHTGMGGAVGMLMDDMRTPLGTAPLDRELALAIGLPHDRSSHVHEHSMEVQVPFLQYIGNDIQQVCISMMDQSIRTSELVGERVARAISDTGRDAVVIASSDLTHCGPNYGYPVPKGMSSGEFARANDMPVIGRIIEMDVAGAYKERDKTGCTACGLGPIGAAMQAARTLGGREARLLNYTTSHDVMPHHSAVGYASIAVH